MTKSDGSTDIDVLESEEFQLTRPGKYRLMGHEGSYFLVHMDSDDEGVIATGALHLSKAGCYNAGPPS